MDAAARRRGQRPHLHHQEPEGPVLGAAMLAAVGAGIHPDLQAAAAEMVHVERTIEPDQGRHQYAFFMDRYTELYLLVKDTMHQVTRHVAGREQP